MAIHLLIDVEGLFLPESAVELLKTELQLGPRKQSPEWLFQVGELHDSVRMPPRLLPFILRSLRELGCEVQVKSRHVEYPALLPKDELNHSYTPLVRETLDAVASAADRVYGGGVIVLKRPGNAFDVIAGIADQFRHHNILIVCKNNSAATRMSARLKELLERPVTCNSQTPARKHAAHVTSMHGFIGRSVTIWPIVIIADLESARSLSVLEQVQCMYRSCVLGIVPDVAVDAEDRLRIAASCGSVIYRQRTEAERHTRVHVAPVFAGRYPSKNPQDPLERKQHYFWQNDWRNREIANIAQAIRSGEPNLLADCGLDYLDLKQFSFVADNEPPGVCVLVESLAHARTLRELLPGWEIFGSRDVVPASNDMPLWGDQAIVTLPRAFDQGIAFDVVIRATGTERQWKDAYGPHTVLHGQDLLIIDVRDDVD